MTGTWDRETVFGAVRSIALSSTGYSSDQVLVQDQDHPLGARPFVRLNTISTVEGSKLRERRCRADRFQADLVAVIDGTQPLYEVLGFGTTLASYVPTSTDLTVIRDGILALLVLSPEAFTATASGLVGIDMVSDVVGVHMQNSASPVAGLTITRIEQNGTKYYSVDTEVTLSIMAYVRRSETTPSLNDDAAAVVEGIAGDIDTDPGRTTLRTGGCTFRRRESIVDLSHVEGAQFETVAAVDVTLAVEASTSHPLSSATSWHTEVIAS